MHFSVTFFEDCGPPGAIITHLERNRRRWHLVHGQAIIHDDFVIGTLVPEGHLKYSFLGILALTEDLF